jgi:hypothetical protein
MDRWINECRMVHHNSIRKVTSNTRSDELSNSENFKLINLVALPKMFLIKTTNLYVLEKCDESVLVQLSH